MRLLHAWYKTTMTYLYHVKLCDAILLHCEWQGDTVLLDQHRCMYRSHSMGTITDLQARHWQPGRELSACETQSGSETSAGESQTQSSV